MTKLKDSELNSLQVLCSAIMSRSKDDVVLSANYLLENIEVEDLAGERITTVNCSCNSVAATIHDTINKVYREYVL